MGPNYRPPSADALGIPATWEATLPHGGNVMVLANWWTRFDDPVLTGLIESAERTNPTIAESIARVEESRTDVTSRRAPLFPSLSGSASRSRENADNLGVQSTGFTDGAGYGNVPNYYVSNGELDASWELDLFGGVRREAEAADASAQASEARWHDARVIVAAEVADVYIELRAAEALERFWQEDLVSRRETMRLTSIKVQQGFVSAANVDLTSASIAEASDELERVRASRAIDINRLVVLAGLSRPELAQRLESGYGDIPRAEAAQLQSVPAFTVEQRPDVRVAERELAAASAAIGSAMAARLPRVSLVGSISTNTYRAGGRTLTLQPWSFGPSVTLPIFDGGANAAHVEAARARYRQAYARYQGKVRQAISEVEDALARIDIADRRKVASASAVKAYRGFFNSIETRYHAGAVSLLDVETARRSAVNSERARVDALSESALAWVTLYKAAGGGWQLPS